MSAICIELVPVKPVPESRNGRRLSVSMNPFGPWLCKGEEVSVYYTRLKPNCWPEHQHRHAELLLAFDEAHVEITWRGPSGQTKSELVAGDQFCLIQPNVPHACEWKEEADVVVVYFGTGMLREELHGPLAGVTVGDFRPLIRLDACLWSLGAIFRDLCRKNERPSASFIESVGTELASRVLELHFRTCHQYPLPSDGLPDPALRRVVEYIDANLHVNITVKDLARHGGLNVDHFSRLLKRRTGHSPLQFLLKCRVQKALELLRTGKFRVGEVANEVGFCDQSHLDRHCRKFFGFPPKTMVAQLTPESF